MIHLSEGGAWAFIGAYLFVCCNWAYWFWQAVKWRERYERKASGTITLADPSDTHRFEKGMRVHVVERVE